MQSIPPHTHPPFGQLRFKHSWRDYQGRLLDELDSKLDDDHLHIVAAPGSGKTVLGLEVIRRLTRPAIILSPTITIRNQWVDRLIHMFLPEGAPYPDWISTDVHAPGHLTVITYQALHAAFSAEDEDEEEDGEEEPDEFQKEDHPDTPATDGLDKAGLIQVLIERKIATLVLDEAHHLRKAWWNALIDLKEGLAAPTVVSLTATPPYDVRYIEWKRYEALCGPIDAEISVPELVQKGDLCPHQDYVYLSTPTPHEADKLQQFKDELTALLVNLKQDAAFLDLIAGHPWLTEPDERIEDILSEPEFFSSLIIFLNGFGRRPSRKVLQILGVTHSRIPLLDAHWLEIFFNGVLYAHADHFPGSIEHLDAVRSRLNHIGAIERRKVNLVDTRHIEKVLAHSLSKLDSIATITRMEAGHLGDALRQVIIIDYIRKEALPRHPDDDRPISKPGVVPIFEYLRRASIPGIKPGILTGSLVVVPAAARPAAEERASRLGIAQDRIRFRTMGHDANYVELDITGEHSQRVVQLVTDLFKAGHITVLVGTQALLGEGWDAPSINTLILASNVGSYMLSNQIRGRAIRIDPDVPDKVANIWHLASVDTEPLAEKMFSLFAPSTRHAEPASPLEWIDDDSGHDISVLKRRFRVFEGLSYDEPVTIKNGFDRLGLAPKSWKAAEIDRLNKETIQRARERERLPELWKNALQGSSTDPAMRNLVGASEAANGSLVIPTLKYLAITAITGGLASGVDILKQFESTRQLVPLALTALGLAAIYALPKLGKSLYLWVKNGTLENSLEQVGRVVLESLNELDALTTDLQDLSVLAFKDRMGMGYCQLEGSTRMEQEHFLTAMQEILRPVENPRYLLIRHSRLGRVSRQDYHEVPALFGQKKEIAQQFTRKWRRHVGPAELVYTRTAQGRKILLKARIHALSSGFQRKTDRLSEWM